MRLILAFLLLFSQGFASVEDNVVNKRELRRLEKEMICLKEVAVAHDILKVARKKALRSDEDSVLSAFRLVSEGHQDFLTRIRDHAKRYSQISGSQELEEALRSFYSKQAILELDFMNINARSYRFLSTLDSLGEVLAIAKAKVENVLGTLEGCWKKSGTEEWISPSKVKVEGNFGSQTLATRLDNELDSWLKRLGGLRQLVSEAHDKRRELLTTLSRSIRFDLEKRYANSVGNDLVELRDRIEGIFAGLDFQIELEEWDLRKLGPRAKAPLLRGRYSQYEPALREWNQVRSEYIVLRDRLDAAPYPDDIKTPLLRRMQGIGGRIDEEIKKLIEGGWQAKFEEQLVLSGAVLEIASQLSEECQGLVNTHVAFKDQIESLEK